MRDSSFRQRSSILWFSASFALSACAIDRMPFGSPATPASSTTSPSPISAAAAADAPAAAPLRGLGCRFFNCLTNFVAVPGLRAPARSVVAGGNSVWALDDTSAIYRFNAITKQFDLMPGSLAWISVGGGNAIVSDEVWGGIQDHRIFSYSDHWSGVFPPPGDPITFVLTGVSRNDDGCHLSEIWTISVSNQVFRSSNCPGSGWVQINGPPILTALATGGGEVWGLDASNQAYRFNPEANIFQHVQGALTRLAVGVDGVWGILDPTPVNTGALSVARVGVVGPLRPQVFQYNAATQAFVQIPNAEMKQIEAGGNGVWALDDSHHVFRLQAATRKFVQIQNATLLSLSVGSGTGVWGIDENHRIRVFVTPAQLTEATSSPTNALP